MQTFPVLTGVTFPVKKDPEWDTDTQLSLAGKKTTLGRRVYPRYKFELIYNFLRADSVNLEWQTMVAFWNLVGGARDLFQFVDPDDSVATTQSFGTADGVTTQFQLLRALVGKAGITWNDPVFAPTITTIFDNAVPTGAYTVNSTGLITFTAAPTAGHVLTWTGTFAFLCRFDADVMGFEEFAHNFWSLSKVAFSSELF